MPSAGFEPAVPLGLRVRPHGHRDRQIFKLQGMKVITRIDCLVLLTFTTHKGWFLSNKFCQL